MKNNMSIPFTVIFGLLVSGAIAWVVTNRKPIEEKPPVESVYDSGFHGFEWKGHKYLRYSDYHTQTFTLLHDPDCPCWTNRLEECR